jgi:TolB-like protein
MAIWSAEIKELEKLYESLRGQLPDLEKELERLFKADDENIVLLYSRRCLEVIIIDLCKCELKRERGTEPLKGIIDKLRKEGKVPLNIITSMDHLNGLSTFGTHPKDFDPEQVKPVLNNLDIIIKWYLKYKETGTDIKAKPTVKISQGIKRAEDLKTNITIPKKRLIGMILGLALLMSIVVAILLFTKASGGGKPIKGIEKSVAVLPFVNLSNDPDQEYFSAGMVDEIRDKLFKIGDIKVIAGTSSERFKNSNLPIKEIARELGVASIMEGSVSKIGNNIRIIVQLIDSKTEAQIWSESYNKGVSDIFLIQRKVAQNVARRLKAVVTPQSRKLIGKKTTINMAAYEAYWRGMLYYRKLNRNDLEIALKYFELAKEKDPGFALAYAGIGRVWRGMQQLSMISVQEGAPKAEAAVERAIEIDSTYSEVNQLMGGIRTWTNWDWIGGEAFYRKAIKLNPQNADAHSSFSHLLSVTGRCDEAMKHIAIALDLDPMNSMILSFYGVDLMFVRRYEDAVKAFQKALDLDPSQGLGINIIIALYFAGKEDEALEMSKKYWNDQDYLTALNEGYKEGGFRSAEKRLADALAKRSDTEFIPAYGVAVQYALADDRGNAIHWLEKAYKEHNPNLPYLLLPVYDNLREDTHFQDLCRKMNLPYKIDF